MNTSLITLFFLQRERICIQHWFELRAWWYVCICLLISIRPVSTTFCMYIQRSNHRASPYRVASGGPAAAHVWRNCCGSCTFGRKGPQAGIRSTNEAKGCGHDVTTCVGPSKGSPTKILETHCWKWLTRGFLWAVLLVCVICIFIIFKLAENWLGLAGTWFSVVD